MQIIAYAESQGIMVLKVSVIETLLESMIGLNNRMQGVSRLRVLG